MRSICFLVIATFVSIAAPAQVTLSNPLELREFNRPADVIKIPTPSAPKLVNVSPLGKVYAMAPDNMPCLVPNFAGKNSMPVYTTPFAEQFIPNAIPGQQLPAKPRLNNHLLKVNKAPKQVSKNLMLDLTRQK
jgi:hypothetical protein